MNSLITEAVQVAEKIQDKKPEILKNYREKKKITSKLLSKLRRQTHSQNYNTQLVINALNEQIDILRDLQ